MFTTIIIIIITIITSQKYEYNNPKKLKYDDFDENLKTFDEKLTTKIF